MPRGCLLVRGLWQEHTAIYTRLNRAFDIEALVDSTVTVTIMTIDDLGDVFEIRLNHVGEFENERQIRDLYYDYLSVITEILNDFDIRNYRLIFLISEEGGDNVSVEFCSDALLPENVCIGWDRGNVTRFGSTSLFRHLERSVWPQYMDWEELLDLNETLDAYLELLENSSLFSSIRLELLPGLEEFLLVLHLQEGVDHRNFEAALVPAVALITEHTPFVPLDFRWINIRTVDMTSEGGERYRIVYSIENFNAPGRLSVAFESDRQITRNIFEWDRYEVDSFEELFEVINNR